MSHDLPSGFRWATADEAERLAGNPESIPGAKVILRDRAADGTRYLVGEADWAVPLPGSGCEIEYVMTGVTTSQTAWITPDGHVQTNGTPEVDDIDGDTYVWCETHQVRIHSGETHEGLTLNDEWEAR